MDSAVLAYGDPVSTSGVNRTVKVVLDGGIEAFHKTFSGVNVTVAGHYGHDPDEPPLLECLAWHMAKALGEPWESMIPPAVLRELNGEMGSLTQQAAGAPGRTEPFQGAPGAVEAAAYWDCLIGQQDRHLGNTRWDGSALRLRLIDHGYAFAKPGDLLNQTALLSWRLQIGHAALTLAEIAAVEAVLASADLFGIEPVLDSTRAAALRDRTHRMRSGSALLPAGEF